MGLTTDFRLEKKNFIEPEHSAMKTIQSKTQRETELNKINRASVICGTVSSRVTHVKMESQKRQGSR